MTDLFDTDCDVDWVKAGREELDEAKTHLSSLSAPHGLGVSLSDLPTHVAIKHLEEGVGRLLTALYTAYNFMEEVDSERKDVDKALLDFNKDMEELSKRSPLSPEVKDATETFEEQRIRAGLFHNEVFPKLNDLLRGPFGMGDMTKEELKVLSACLDVAIAARDNKRR